jgi:MoaA/NifB/PqqE/SkfB family radical SAM enzyme
MDFNDFKNIVEKNLHNFKGKNVTYEGELGDPMVHPQVKKFIEFGCEIFGGLTVVTNGGLRNPNFYKSLSQYKNLTLVFSIDGLEEDTNQIYRKKVNTKKAIENMITFAKIRPRNTFWQFLVFEHNFFEIPEVLDLSKKYSINVYVKINQRPKFIITENRLKIAKNLYENNKHHFSKFTMAN